MFSQIVSSTATSLDPLTLEPLPPETRQRLLRFPLSPRESALLPLDQITEILRLNVADILPVPEMPSCVLGICNWRGEMLWLIDLNHLVGCPPVLNQGQVSASPVAMVVQVNDHSIGLVVSQVNDIELHELEHLQPAAPGLFPPKLLPFVLGALPGVKGSVLDITAIARSPMWKMHQRGVS
ncbi:MAG: chemotaxis protein CheW [Coleofasciculus sp. Co-bin14]|nr:chemotaxis protein CheW [Coleofasciculus sp. Co-bin14]